MKEVTFEFSMRMTKTVRISELSKKWQQFIEAWFKDEDDRTDADWDIVEENSFDIMLSELFDCEADNAECLNYK